MKFQKKGERKLTLDFTEKVPLRTCATKIIGLKTGANVFRGIDWIWGNEDGESGQPGQIISFDKWISPRDTVIVKWEKTGLTANYRVGCHGKVDVSSINLAAETIISYANSAAASTEAAVTEAAAEATISTPNSTTTIPTPAVTEPAADTTILTNSTATIPKSPVTEVAVTSSASSMTLTTVYFDQLPLLKQMLAVELSTSQLREELTECLFSTSSDRDLSNSNPKESTKAKTENLFRNFRIESCHVPFLELSALVDRACYLFENGLFMKALKAYTLAINLLLSKDKNDPNLRKLYWQRAKCRIATHMYDLAYSDLQEIAINKPHYRYFGPDIVLKHLKQMILEELPLDPPEIPAAEDSYIYVNVLEYLQEGAALISTLRARAGTTVRSRDTIEII